MAWASAVVLLAFGAAMAVAGIQTLWGSKGEPRAALPAEIQVVERSRVGLFGLDKTVVVPDTLVTDTGMAWAAEEVRGVTAERGFVRTYFYTDEEAARLAEAGRAGELEERQPWFDAHYVGLYQRNERVSLEELTWAPSGLERGPARTVEW